MHIDNPSGAAAPNAGDTVYIRPILVDDLPQDLKTHIDGLDTVYSVHNDDGVRIALVSNSKLAFLLARQHDLMPVYVH